jgi:hypothetical protein
MNENGLPGIFALDFSFVSTYERRRNAIVSDGPSDKFSQPRRSVWCVQNQVGQIIQQVIKSCKLYTKTIQVSLIQNILMRQALLPLE